MRVYHIKTQKMCLYKTQTQTYYWYKCSNSPCAIGYPTNTPLDFSLKAQKYVYSHMCIPFCTVSVRCVIQLNIYKSI